MAEKPTENEQPAGGKTALGISENLEALLCYPLGWITGLIFLLIEKENQFVRFHAVQSLVVFLALTILSMVVGIIPIIGLVLSPIIWIVSVVLVLFLMYKAYMGERFKIPWAGDLAEKQLQE